MFTFKTNKPTGKWRSFHSTTHDIKIKRKLVGSIDDAHPHKIRLTVIKKDILEDGNKNCDWKWIVLKKKSESLEEAKLFLQENYEAILKRYNLKGIS